MGHKNSSKELYEYRDNLPRCLKFLGDKAENTQKNYFQTVRKYEKFHEMPIEDLVLEALDEQDNHVPMHRLKVIDRIEDFQNHLYGCDLVLGTIINHMSHIKSIYIKNRVSLPYIEPLNIKRCKKKDTIEFSDILTKEELKKALALMKLPVRARAMVMLQGGLSNEECEHLTTRSFIDELYKYHKRDDDLEALKWLADENNPVIWVTKMIRVKTGKPYYVLIGAEAVNTLASAKLYEYGLPSNNNTLSDKLSNVNKSTMNRICSKLNRRLDLGKAGGTYRLRPHMLRKFHATYIRGSALTYEENVRISNSQIDEMQGRGKTSVQDTYIKSNPLEQKLIYAKVMNNVSLYNEYDYRITDDDVIVIKVNPHKENNKLRREVRKLSEKLKQKQKTSEKIEEMRKELGDDGFNELIYGILNPTMIMG